LSDLRCRVEYLEAKAGPGVRSREEFVALLDSTPSDVLNLMTRSLLAGALNTHAGSLIEWDETHAWFLDPATGRVLEEHQRNATQPDEARVNQRRSLLLNPGEKLVVFQESMH
jgi:hypothetical protein